MRKTTRPDRKPPTTIPKERSAHDAELVDSMSDLLDAIDDVLDHNALIENGGQ